LRSHTHTRIDVLCSWFAKHGRFIKCPLHSIDVIVLLTVITISCIAFQVGLA